MLASHPRLLGELVHCSAGKDARFCSRLSDSKKYSQWYVGCGLAEKGDIKFDSFLCIPSKLKPLYFFNKEV